MDSSQLDLQGSQKGVSNTTIVVLIIVLLAVSVLGAIAVMNSKAPAPVSRTATSSENGNTAQVVLNIQPSRPANSQTSGEISLEITR